MDASRPTTVAEQLADVLKMPTKRKWAFLSQIALTRDASLLATLSQKNQDDVTAVNEFVKLLKSGAKKTAFGHVATEQIDSTQGAYLSLTARANSFLRRTIRITMLDSEWIMEILCSHDLDKIILGSISDLRKKITEEDPEMRATACSKLEQILLNTADLFEWEFFAERRYEAFAAELLNILAHCDGSRGNLHTEAASVLMSMCSTNIQGVCSSVANNAKQRELLRKLVRDIAQAKSFHSEALLLEIVYRVQRQLRKSEDPATKELASTIVASFPNSISAAFVEITPKNFRESTRLLLNDFNLAIGVIESFKVSSLECVMPKNRTINIGETTWIDAGKNVLEAEVTWKKETEKRESILKLPFSSIHKVELDATKCAVSLRVNPKTRLVDLLEGINDAAWANLAGFQLTVHSDQETTARLLASIQRKTSRGRSEDLENAKAATVSKQPTPDASTRKSIESQPQVQDTESRKILEVNAKSAVKTNHVAKKSENPGGRRQKPEPKQKVSTKALEYAFDQTGSPDSSKLKQKALTQKRSIPDISKSSKKAPVQSKLEGVVDKLKKATMKTRERGIADKAKKRALSFAGDAQKIRHSSPTNFTKQKQPPTPFASGSRTSSANPDTNGKKRDAEHVRAGTNSMGKVAVIPNSPQHDKIKRPKVGTQAGGQQEQKASTSRSLITTGERIEETRPRTAEVRKGVNFLDPGETKSKNETLRSEEKHSAFLLSQQPSQTSSDASSVECRSPGYTLKPHHSRQAKTAEGTAYRDDYASPNVVESANEADSAPSQRSFGASQQVQYQTLRRLVDDILEVQESFRAHLLSSTCETLQRQVEKDLLKKSALLHGQHFLPSDNECARMKASVTDHHEQIAGFQQTMDEVIARCSTLGQRVQSEASSIEEHIHESVKTEWRQILDSTVKKAKSQHTKRMGQAKDKMRSIENSFDTDGLMVMQQMLHRI